MDDGNSLGGDVLLVNWSPLQKNLAIKQYVTEILKAKGKKKNFSARHAWFHVSSVNMNRVIQTENPPKWFHDFFFDFIYISILQVSPEKKKSEITQHPEVERNSPGNSFFQGFFVERFASQKKKDTTSTFEA